jgi:TPR repeat protein
MYDLGWMYEHGQGVDKDYAKARVRYQKAADVGHPDAMNDLGLLYAKGLGGAQDYGKAREWYQKAVAAGNAEAMKNLGGLYELGYGVVQDYAKAREWYQKAADAGNVEAKQALRACKGKRLRRCNRAPHFPPRNGLPKLDATSVRRITQKRCRSYKSPPMLVTQTPCTNWARST